MRASLAGWVLLWAWLPGLAAAHSARSVSYSDLVVHGTTIRAALRISAEDLIEVLALDQDRDGRLEAAEVAAGRTLLTDYLRNNLVLRALEEREGAPPRLDPCPPTLERIEPPLPDDAHHRWRLSLTYRCGRCRGSVQTCGAAPSSGSCASRPGCTWEAVSIRDLSVRATLFQGASFAHQHQATARLGGRERVLFFDGRAPEQHVVVSLGAQILGYLWHGVMHIWTGYDHLVFLFGLLLLGGTLPTLVKIVTSFTVAHSITLILAGLGIFTLPSAFVEAAIAVTIAYIGVENLFLKSPQKRWIITFFLGLVHGFGFAGALAESGLPTKGFVLTLFTFNVGVELGQVAVVMAVWPLLLWLHRQRWSLPAVRTLSVGIALFGLVLFVLRTFFGV